MPTGMVAITIFIVTRLLSVVIIRARRCLIAFHINTMTNILGDLQILLKKQQKNYHPKSMTSIDSIENIRNLRHVYLNVWQLKNLMSSCFGWSLVLFLVEFSFEFINSFYWMYLNIGKIKSKTHIMSKSPSVYTCEFMCVRMINL